MIVVSPFRVTPDDLAGLDSKTSDGLSPLLDALNITLQQLVQASGAVSEAIVPVALVIGASVDDSFPLVFRHNLGVTPRAVMLANITPKDPDHLKTTPFVMQGWGLTDNGLISVPWVTGLLSSNIYTLSFLVKA